MKKSYIWLVTLGGVVALLFALHLLTYWYMRTDYRVLTFRKHVSKAVW